MINKNKTNKLDLKHFKHVIDKDEYIVKNFTELNQKQKRHITEFVNHADNLLAKIENRFVGLKKQKAVEILNDLTHDIFITDTANEADAQSKQMQTFNNLSISKLIELLENIVQTTDKYELESNDTEVLTHITNRFWHQIVLEEKLE